MKQIYSKALLAALIVPAVLLAQPSMASASGNVRITSTATLGAYTSYDPGTCDDSTYLPPDGEAACVSTIGEEYNATGDFAGTLQLELTFTTFADGSLVFTDYQLWDGTLNDGRAGSFVVIEQGTEDLAGNYSSELKVVEGSGSGDFAGVTGKGTSNGDIASGVNQLNLKF
jgi:Protein of unknown function (DUF3224)